MGLTWIKFGYKLNWYHSKRNFIYFNIFKIHQNPFWRKGVMQLFSKTDEKLGGLLSNNCHSSLQNTSIPMKFNRNIAQYILITRIMKYLKNIFKNCIFYTKFLICGKIGHLTQMRSKMWTYKHWQYLNDGETDVAEIVTQSTLIYLKSTKIHLWKKSLHETFVETFLKNLKNRQKDCCKNIFITY